MRQQTDDHRPNRVLTYGRLDAKAAGGLPARLAPLFRRARTRTTGPLWRAARRTDA